MDRLPTRVALQQRGVLTFSQGPSCVFCFRNNEDIEHLFFLCNTPRQIWQQVSEWLGAPQVAFTGQWQHFQQQVTVSVRAGKKKKKVQHLVWIAVVLVISIIISIRVAKNIKKPRYNTN